MQAFYHLVALTSPMFLLVGLGYALAAWRKWPAATGDALTRFVFSVAIPLLLFKLMSGFSQLPPVDPWLLLAYFGGCLVVFGIGRLASRAIFGHDGGGQSVFALGGIFSNSVLLGIPLTKVTLGEAAMPVTSMIVVFNALLLWTLVTVSVEWARNGEASFAGFGRTIRDVVANPIVSGIFIGVAWSYTGLSLPAPIDTALTLIAQAAVSLSLVALGMGLARYGVTEGWRESLVIVAIKLVVFPLVVYGLARAISLPPRETTVVVVMAALPTGANVYLMSRQFNVLEGPIASSLVLSTLLAALTTPVTLALMGAGTP